MAKRIHEIEYGKIYQSNNYGNFIFLEELEPQRFIKKNGRKDSERRARIRFLQTGTEVEVYVRAAMHGRVKDPYFPTICNIGYVGNTYTDGDHRPWYDKWKAMINRCHNPDDKRYINYGAQGVTVCNEWLSFEGFMKTPKLIKNYAKLLKHPEQKWAMDKDILQQNLKNKIYSPMTCMFVSVEDNNQQSAIDNKHKRSSEYYGISLTEGRYKVQPSVKTPYGAVGSYTDEIAAVNAREWFRHTYAPNAIPNKDYPEMPLDEVVKYRCLNKKRLPFYHLIPEARYVGVRPYEHSSNKYKITDMVHPSGEPFPIFVNQDAAVNVREYCRALYYPHLPANFGYVKMTLEEAMRFRYRNENPKKLYTLIDKNK